MVHGEWIVVCVGLMIGTYLIRALPFLSTRLHDLPRGMERFLFYVPPAALAALVFPDALHTHPLTAAIAVGAAFALTLRGVSLTTTIVVVVAGGWAILALTM